MPRLFFSAAALLFGALALGGCAALPADAPAHFSRMGRFMGLTANCGCAGVPAERMIAAYADVVKGTHSPEEIRAMGGYVRLGAEESWDNMPVVCAEVCSQRCMVQTVSAPLGGRDQGVPPCPVTERDLHLTDGSQTYTGGNE